MTYVNGDTVVTIKKQGDSYSLCTKKNKEVDEELSGFFYSLSVARAFAKAVLFGNPPELEAKA